MSRRPHAVFFGPEGTLAEGGRLFPDVNPAFYKVSDAGMRNFAVSGDTEALRRALATRGLEAHVLTYYQVGPGDLAEVFETYARELELPPERIALVSADPGALRAASRAGWATAWVHRGDGAWPEGDARPEVEGRDLVEIMDRLFDLPH